MDQNVYWLNSPIAPGKTRTFAVRAKVSTSVPTGLVIISTLVYSLDANGTLICASTMQDATVSRFVWMGVKIGCNVHVMVRRQVICYSHIQ